jgi:prepilin-type N-terminal cleavage/methylation domain-containing protein
MRNIKLFKNNKGFTLVELLGVLVAIAILSAGIARFVLKANANATADEDAKQAGKITECVKDSRTAPTYSGLDTEVLINTGCLNNLNMINLDRDVLLTNYGGSVTVEATEFNGVDDLAVLITADGYDSEQCVRAVEHRIAISPVVSVDGEEVKAQGQDIVDIANITEACGSEDLIEISWIVTR